MPAPGAGVLTVIVPVASAHVGWVGVAVGVGGAAGGELMVTINAAEVHPAAFFVVTL